MDTLKSLAAKEAQSYAKQFIANELRNIPCIENSIEILETENNTPHGSQADIATLQLRRLPGSITQPHLHLDLNSSHMQLKIISPWDVNLIWHNFLPSGENGEKMIALLMRLGGGPGSCCVAVGWRLWQLDPAILCHKSSMFRERILCW